MNQSAQKPRLLWTWPEACEDDSALHDVLDSFAHSQVSSPTQAQLRSLVERCEILVPRLTHTVDKALIDLAPHLAMIGTPSTGSDHIDTAAAKQRGIEVVTLKDEREFLDSVQATAEMSWLLILACHRRLREAFLQIERTEWDPQEIRGHELIGKTLGIIGYGRLGSMVSRFASAFRMKVIATDPIVRISDPWVTQLPLDQLLSSSDVISIHVHLTVETRRMINADAIARMKPGVVVVNTSRGAVIDETALINALRSGHIAAAGLDVMEGERDVNRDQHPVLAFAAGHPQLIVTPHLGGCTVESQQKAFAHFARLLKRRWLARCASVGDER